MHGLQGFNAYDRLCNAGDHYSFTLDYRLVSSYIKLKTANIDHNPPSLACCIIIRIYAAKQKDTILLGSLAPGPLYVKGTGYETTL